MGHKPDRKARARRTAKKQPKRGTRPLPAQWGGADVVKGAPLSETHFAGSDLDTFLERHALDVFQAGREMYLVVEDKALEDLDDTTQIHGFLDKEEALKVARARACGNVDHRVLTITAQTLVVATMNDL